MPPPSDPSHLRWIKSGVSRFVLQECRTPDRVAWPGKTALDDTALMAELGAQFQDFEVRRAQH